MEVALGDCDHVANWCAERSHCGIVKQGSAGDGGGDLDVRQMVRRVENVAGSIPQLVISKLLLLARMLLVHNHKGSRVRFSPQSVVNQTIGQHLVQRQ